MRVTATYESLILSFRALVCRKKEGKIHESIGKNHYCAGLRSNNRNFDEHFCTGIIYTF